MEASPAGFRTMNRVDVAAGAVAGRLVGVVGTAGMLCGAALVGNNAQENRQRHKILHFMYCSSPHFLSLRN